MRRGSLHALNASQALDRGAMNIESVSRRVIGADDQQLELGAGRHVEFGARRADVGDQLDQPADLGVGGGVDRECRGQGWPISMPCSARWPSLSHSSSVMNGITGCRSFDRLAQHEGGDGARLVLVRPVVALQDRLGELDVPVADDAPDES